MIPYLILAALILLLPIIDLLPIERTGKSDTNYVWGITLLPVGHAKDKTQPRRARRAQEIAEWWLKWLVALILAAYPAWLVRDIPAAPAVQALIVFTCTAWTKIRPLQRQFELIGHAVEIEVAERMGWAGYQALEAGRMRRGYDGLFASMTPADLVTALERRRGIARVLIALLSRRIGR